MVADSIWPATKSYPYRAAEAPAGEPTNFARNRLAAWNALPLAESFPAISAIEVDLLDNLWVREYNLPGEEGRALWTVFDPDGLVLGLVETPPGLVIYEIGEDYILGKVSDELLPAPPGEVSRGSVSSLLGQPSRQILVDDARQECLVRDALLARPERALD